MVVLKTGNTDRVIGEKDKPIKNSSIIGALLTNNTELTLYTYVLCLTMYVSNIPELLTPYLLMPILYSGHRDFC